MTQTLKQVRSKISPRVVKAARDKTEKLLALSMLGFASAQPQPTS